MHAVVVSVTVHDREAAISNLREEVIPQVSGAPGFVAGYWVALDGGRGTSVVVFESEDGARTAAGRLQVRGDFVTVDSVEVGEVVASA